jgi:hypothetical protein
VERGAETVGELIDKLRRLQEESRRESSETNLNIQLIAVLNRHGVASTPQMIEDIKGAFRK